MMLSIIWKALHFFFRNLLVDNNSCANMDSSKTMTFWELLRDSKVEIPIIQRDYAQGRRNKIALRRLFLTRLFESLSNKTTLELDFIYSAELRVCDDGKKVIAPLDGQQRLTTLWLLHWYLATKAGLLLEKDSHKEEREILKNFTYRTRISSRQFCELLCTEVFPSDIIDIKDYICSRTWFRSSWKNDPTIKAMLCMMTGTVRIDKKNNKVEEQDGIEQVFNNADYGSMWKSVTESCPIIFHHLDLVKLKLSDELYIKMNARGRFLSSFENFKADFLGYLKDKHDEFNDPESGIPIKLDTSWTSILWNTNKDYWQKRQKILDDKQSNVKLEFNVDIPFFAFVNRLFFDGIIVSREEEDKYLFTASELENNIPFNYLTGPRLNNSYDDTQIEYSSFDHYRFCKITQDDNTIFSIPLSFIKRFVAIFDNCIRVTNKDIIDCFPERHKNLYFNFIPMFSESDNAVDSIPQTMRVLFSAICMYFAGGGYDKTSFTQWMRVCWNIIDEKEIDSVGSMIARIRKIDSIADGAHKIYYYLANEFNDAKNGNAKWDQLEEECWKAIKIQDDSKWEEIFKTWENYSFFNGSIRFLFRGIDGQVKWDDFEKKCAFAGKNLTCDFTKSTDPVLMERLFSFFSENDFYECLNYRYRVFNNSSQAWRYYLLNDNLCRAVHMLLMDREKQEVQQTGNNGARYLSYLSSANILGYIMENIPSSWIRWYHNHDAIYPSSTGIFLNARERDDFFSQNIGRLTIDKSHQIPNSKFLFGSNIFFSFKGKRFIWDENDRIVSAENNNLNFSVKGIGNTEIVAKLNENLQIWFPNLQ